MNISQVLTKLKALIYSKSETDSLLGGKANSSHTHTKSQITDFPTIPSKTSQLTNDSGFITGVAWSSVTGKPSFATVATSGSYSDLSNKPSSMTPSSHSHGNITNAGAIGTTANKPLITTTNGAITTGSFGTTANTFCQGNDSRLSDARTPTSHTHTKSQITDFPTIPSKTSQLTNDSGFITGISWANVSGKPSTFAPSSHIHTTMEGTYSGNGGKQGPSYYGKNRVGFLMSNESINGDSDYKNWLYMDNYAADDVGGATAIGVDRMHAKAFIMQSSAARSVWNESAELLSSRHLGTEMGTASFVIHRNGISSPGWRDNGTSSSVLQIRTTDNTEPSICFHRSGHSHCVLGEQSGELVTHQEGGTKYRINHDGKTTLNGYQIYVG